MGGPCKGVHYSGDVVLHSGLRRSGVQPCPRASRSSSWSTRRCLGVESDQGIPAQLSSMVLTMVTGWGSSCCGSLLGTLGPYVGVGFWEAPIRYHALQSIRLCGVIGAVFNPGAVIWLGVERPWSFLGSSQSWPCATAPSRKT